VTLRELLGVVGLNAVYVVAGVGIVAAARPPGSAFVRLLAATHLLGFAFVSLVDLLLLIVFDAEPGVGSSLLPAACVAALGAWRMRDRRPRLRIRLGGRDDVVALAFAAAFLAGCAQLLRLAYQQGLSAWDAWSFWTPKALSIARFGLDSVHFSVIAARTYPLLVPVTDVTVFAYAGGTDVVPLSLQFFFLFIGFAAAVWAVAGLLGARPLTIWPALALLVVIPAGVGRYLAPQADFTLDYLFVVGLGLALVWVRTRAAWALLLALVPWAAAEIGRAHV